MLPPDPADLTRPPHRRRSVRFRLATVSGLILAPCWPVGCGPDATPPDPKEAVLTSRAHERAADSALTAGDTAGYAEHLAAAADLRPNYPGLLYQLATARAVLRDTASAVAGLTRLADMGIAIDLGRNRYLDALRDVPTMRDLARRLLANADARERSDIGFTVPMSGLWPEGVAYDSVTGAFFAGSVSGRRIVRIMGDEATVFADTAGAPLWSVMGMTVDPIRRTLWAATTATEHMVPADSAAIGRSAIVAFDLTSGLVRHVTEPTDSGPYWFGDVALGPDGSVYTTDSQGGGVYRVALEGGLDTVLSRGALLSPQGVAVSRDGSRLFIADYALGIVRVDLADGTARTLETPPDATLLGIDGLTWHGMDLIAIQNGVSPLRVVRVELDMSASRVERVAVLESNHDVYPEPTIGVVVRDTLFYVGNSTWEGEPEAGAMVRGVPRAWAIVLALPLSER